MDQSIRTRELQNEVIGFRLECPIIYEKCLKKEFKNFVKNLRNGEIQLPDNLINVNIDSSSTTFDNKTEVLEKDNTEIINVLDQTMSILTCMNMITKK